jgi:hypothetical protein
MLKVVAEYLELRVKKYEDGKYEAYEALGDHSKESVNWQDIKDWIINQLEDLEKECPELLEPEV